MLIFLDTPRKGHRPRNWLKTTLFTSAAPDRTFEEAAALAAHFSKGHSQDKVEVDYVLKKEVKKPAGSKPGFVVYYTNYSMIASTFIDEIKQC